MPQNPIVFGADVWTNIRFGWAEASDVKMKAAARAAHGDFVDNLPQG